MSKGVEGSQSPPFRFRFRKAVDGVRFGREEIDYYHSKPIPKDRAQQLYAKLNDSGLNKKEVKLLSEYERARLYERRRREMEGGGAGGKALCLASGYDGIPAHVLGSENVVMSSLERSSPYLTFLGGTEEVDKVEADMFSLPFPDGHFSTLILNNMDVFDRRFIEGVAPDEALDSEDIVGAFFRNARRVVSSGGKLIITDSYELSGIDDSRRRSLEEAGWEIEDSGSSPVLDYCVLTAVE